MMIIEVTVADIKHGDTVEHLGHLRTVGKDDVKYNGFFGWTLFNDSYKLGRTPVRKVIFPKFLNGVEIVQS